MSVIICAHTQYFSHCGIGMEILVGTGWRDSIEYKKLSESQGVYRHISFYFDSRQSTRQQLWKSGGFLVTES